MNHAHFIVVAKRSPHYMGYALKNLSYLFLIN